MEGTCPECGLPVKVTLRQDRLSDAPASWRRRLVWGNRLLWAGMVLAFPLVYPGLLVATVGLWLLTSAESGRREPVGDWRHRMGARLLLLLAWLGMAALVVAIAVRGRHAPPGSLMNIWQLYDGAFIGIHAAFVLGLIGCWDYLRILGQRADDPALVRACRRARWHWIIGIAGFAALGLAAWIAFLIRMSGVGGGARLLRVDVGLMVAAVLLVWLWVTTWRVPYRLGQMLKKVQAEAQGRGRTER